MVVLVNFASKVPSEQEIYLYLLIRILDNQINNQLVVSQSDQLSISVVNSVYVEGILDFLQQIEASSIDHNQT